MNIYIVGYPCCGKTSLGKKIAKKIGYNFVDLDHLFEEEYKITIPDFFEKYSEEAFRICERKILHSTASLKKNNNCYRGRDTLLLRQYGVHQ